MVYITIFNIQALRLYSNTTAICAAICAGAAASAPTLYRCTSIKLRLKLPRLGWVNRREIGHPRTDPNRRLSGRKIYEFLINFEMFFFCKFSVSVYPAGTGSSAPSTGSSWRLSIFVTGLCTQCYPVILLTRNYLAVLCVFNSVTRLNKFHIPGLRYGVSILNLVRSRWQCGPAVHTMVF